jgi:transcriptional regulator with GAF, ATPase, and Fis domain/serine/threonine protein kinase/lipopolysaccharide biosynthesis regulator YciM
MRLKPGDTLTDRYRIASTLGRGGSATTYLAHDLTWNVPVALKLLHAGSATLLDTLRAEFDVLRGSSHPHLSRVHDFGFLPATSSDARCFYTSDPIDGVTLDRAAKKSSWPVLRPAIIDVLHALRWLHALGLRHGDVKPSNVLVRADGRAVLIDLGCARPLGGPFAELSGTPAYMAPELLAGRSADGRADLFALGRTLDQLQVSLPQQVKALSERLQRPSPADRACSVEEVLEAIGCEPAAQPRAIGRSGLLAGRKPQMAVARALLDGLLEKRPAQRILWVQGEEGVGKSRLLREIKWDAQQRFRVIEVNPGSPSALHDALSRACQLREPAHTLDAVLRARESLESSQASPSVLLLDDANRLSEEQAEALCALLRGLSPASSLLAIVSSVDSAPADVSAESLSLQPLDLESLTSWVSTAFPPRALEALHRLTGGYPSLVRVVLDQIERGELADDVLLRASATLPTTERQLAAARALTAEGKRMLGALVVLGGSLSPTERESMRLTIASADEVVDAGLADREGAGWKLRRSGEGHGLLRALGEDQVRDLHREVAAVLEGAGTAASTAAASEHRARIVFHLVHAGDLSRAREELVGSQQLHEAAPRSWRRAAQAVLDRQDSFEVALILARLEHQAGDVRGARDRLTHLIESAGPTDVPSVMQELAVCAMKLGNLDETVSLLERARGAAGPARTGPWASATVLLARALTRRGAYREALAACEEGLAGASAEAVRADLLESAAVARSFLGDAEGARGHLDEAGPIWQRMDDPRRVARSWGSRALVEYRAGQLDAAAEGYRLALETAEAHGLTDLIATAALNLGTLCHQRGDWTAAMGSYERGMRVAVALGQAGTETVLRFNLAKLYADVGLFDRAKTMAERCLASAGRAAQPLMEAAARTVLGEVAAAARDFDGAVSALERALEPFASRESQRECAEIHLQLADIALERGDRDRASSLAAHAGSCLVGVDARDVAFRVDLMKARTGLAAGRPQDALALAERVARGAEELGQRDLTAEAHLLLAALWETQGSSLLARKHRDRAQEVWEEAAARLPEAFRASFWKHPRRAALPRALPEPARDRASRREQKLELLIDINKRLNSSLDAQEVLTRAMDAAIELTGAERGFVLLAKATMRLSPSADTPTPPSSKPRKVPASTLHVAVARNLDREQIGRSHLKFSRAIAEKVIRDGHPVVTADARDDSRFQGNKSVHAMQLQSVACVPVSSPAGVLGALYLDNRFRRGSFDAEDVDLLMALADQVALALENARLLGELVRRNEELDKQRRRVEALARGQAAEIDRLTQVVRTAQQSLQHRYDYSNIVGASPAMQAVFDVLDRVIDSSLPVLIQGESGTGKELVARALHYQGPHRDGPMITVNCGAVPETLLESELFGHVKGAFTGADRDRDGLVVKARGGTLFLDELGELPLAMQVKLLRVLQEREVRPLGASRSIPVDFRLVSATNRNLLKDVQHGRFREDLYYRVSVIELTLPPLRDRVDDIPDLARRLLERASERTKKPAPVLTTGALRKLMAFPWPGNVRQLENVLLRASILADEQRLGAQDISLPEASAPANALTREEYARREMQQIADALAAHRWNVALVARALGIPRPSLYRKLRRYGLVRRG